MKKSIKKQLLTGIAAVALVAPMVLGGFSAGNIHADNAPQTAASAQQSTVPQGNASAQNAGSNNGKPKKTITMQQFKQMLAAQAAKQKQQMAKQMKGATTIFVIKGHEIYTVKAKGTQAFPSTIKKYMPLRRFLKVTKPKREVLQRAVVRYRATHAKKYLRQIQNNIKYVRLARLSTPKQSKQTQKSRSNKVRRHVKTNRKVHKRNHRARNTKRTRIHKRIKRSRRRVRKNRKKRNRRSASTFVVKDNGTKETMLKSEFKRNNWKRAKRSGFAKGPTLDNIKTMFNRYKPNDRRAVVPKSYKIIPDDTTWLVGRHTDNVNRINHMRNVYYYNGKFHGWSNIGYK